MKATWISIGRSRSSRIRPPRTDVAGGEERRHRRPCRRPRTSVEEGPDHFAAPRIRSLVTTGGTETEGSIRLPRTGGDTNSTEPGWPQCGRGSLTCRDLGGRGHRTGSEPKRRCQRYPLVLEAFAPK